MTLAESTKTICTGYEDTGRCYWCGGELIPFNFDDVELTAVTPKGIKIYKQKEL